MGAVRGAAVAVAAQPPGQMDLGAVDGEDAVPAPQPARCVGGDAGEQGAMHAEEGPAADLAAGHAHRGGGDGIVVGREEPLLPALAPQFGERRAIALQPGGQHKAEDEPHDEQRVHFAAALHPLPVVAAQPVPDRGQQVLPQRGELAPPPGRVGRDGPRPAATARERPVAQQLAEIRSQGQGPDLLGGLRRLAAVRLAARCQARQLPARRLVAGAGMLLRIHIRFQQERAAAMELVPVGRQLARRQRQRVRGKVFHLHPGQDGHTIPTLGMRRSPSITGSIRWPGSGWSAWGAAPCAAPPSWWLPTRKESAITFLCG